MVGSRPAAIFLERQGVAWADLESWAGRYSWVADHRRYAEVELARAKINTLLILVSANARKKTQNACGDRLGQQSGPSDLGDADEE